MSVTLPDTLEGHWVTAEGREIAQRYVDMERADLAMGELSDLEIANAIYLADRNQLDLLAYQEAAKQRIRWLSAQLAIARGVPQRTAGKPYRRPLRKESGK